jgi:NADH-quinone oxidoreductase subunit D
MTGTGESKSDSSGQLLNSDMGVGGLRSTLKPRPLGDDLHSETMVLNLGPAHPATHGTVRIVVELAGEKIVNADVEIGYLHRGFEKMCETVGYNQVMPYTDRLNYVSPIINNCGWCMTVERVLGVEVPLRAQYIRILLSEVSRICDHLTCLGAAAMELGGFTVMLYMMEAREELWMLIEEVTGARLTISYARVGGLKYDLPDDFGDKLLKALDGLDKHLLNCDRLLTRNRIFVDRMCDVAVISGEEAISYGLSGPMLRGSGVNYDLRKAYGYGGYDHFDFDVPLGTKGDNYDRFLVRFEEIRQSARIIKQAIAKMPSGAIAVDDPHIVIESKESVYNSIDGMINHFEMVIFGVKPPASDVYFAVEGGNGELGFYLVSDGSGTPYKLHVRGPSTIHMGIFKKAILGANLSDIIPTFGMTNMIGGECDK